MESIKVKAFLIGFVLSVLCFQHVQAQSFSFSDLFGQGEKDIKNLEAQVAALNAFETSMRQGYNMLHSEWSMIGNFKNGEFTLHQSYYNSLSAVNPVVKSSVNVSTLQAEQQSIISRFNAIGNLTGLTTDEQTYIASVRQNVINQCSKDLDDLQTVLTANQLVMSDDERIKRINQITAAIKDKYVFTCSFTSQVKILAAQRGQETNVNSTLNQLYETN